MSSLIELDSRMVISWYYLVQFFTFKFSGGAGIDTNMLLAEWRCADVVPRAQLVSPRIGASRMQFGQSPVVANWMSGTRIASRLQFGQSPVIANDMSEIRIASPRAIGHQQQAQSLRVASLPVPPVEHTMFTLECSGNVTTSKNLVVVNMKDVACFVDEIHKPKAQGELEKIAILNMNWFWST